MKAHLIKNEVSRLLEFVTKVKITHPDSGEETTIEKSKQSLTERQEWRDIRNDWMDWCIATFKFDEFIVSFEPEWRIK